MTTRAEKALNQMRATQRRMEAASERSYDLRAGSLALQLNTQALVAIAEELDAIRRQADADDEREWHPATPKVEHDGFAVGGRR
jgi:hypothetical protein